MQKSNLAHLQVFETVSRLSRPIGRRPDFARFERALTTREPGPVPFGDLFAERETIAIFLNQPVLVHSEGADDPSGPVTEALFRGGLRFADQTIQFCLQNGWDHAWCYSRIPFGGSMFQPAENAFPEVESGKQYWIDDNQVPTGIWDDFKRYPWPSDVRPINFSISRCATT